MTSTCAYSETADFGYGDKEVHPCRDTATFKITFDERFYYPDPEGPEPGVEKFCDYHCLEVMMDTGGVYDSIVSVELMNDCETVGCVLDAVFRHTLRLPEHPWYAHVRQCDDHSRRLLQNTGELVYAGVQWIGTPHKKSLAHTVRAGA